MKPKIYISNRVYVPLNSVSMEHVEKSYTKNMYEDKICATCEYRVDRHSEMCDTCPAFKERFVLYNTTCSKKGVEYVGLPIGDKLNMQKKAKIDFSDFKIIDKRNNNPFDYPIKFLATLRPAQNQLVKDFMSKKYGLIVAPPRSGKTITMLYICLELGQKVLVLANQHEFLTQFMDHIHGNEKEGIPKCTNLPELEQKYGKKLYGIPKTVEDFKTMQIMFMPYQSLISEKYGKDRLNALNKYTGSLCIDECFSYEHRVKTDKGMQSIGDIVTGKVKVKKVLSRNLKTGNNEYSNIESVTKKTTTTLCKVVVSGKSYLCTPNHLFYVKDQGWVEAKDLVKGLCLTVE